ncbi:MAG: glycosyltransferase family 4 protein [Actinomycetes bacterium]
MTRILVITNMYPPHHYGGYETTCDEVVARWREHGHEVHVLTSDWRLPDRPQQPEPHVTRTLRMYWHDHVILHPSRPTRVRWELSNQRELRKALAGFRPDVVSVWHLGALSLAIVAKVLQREVPIVFNVHDDWLVYGPGMDAWTRMFEGRPRFAHLTQRLTRVPANAPDLGAAGAFCFVSAATREHAVNRSRWRFPLSTVVWNGIDPGVFRPTERDPRWRWRLLYAGRIDPRKGVDTVIRAMPGLPAEATLIVAGRGDDDYARSLSQLAAELGVSDRVTFTVLDRPDLVRTYAEVDAVVFPSRWQEPFGLVPVEAMACGTPVVATGTGGSAEFLADGVNCLLFDSEDVAILNAQLQRLANDSALRARVVDGGYATAAELTIDRLADVLETWHVAAARGYPDGPPPDRSRPVITRSR